MIYSLRNLLACFAILIIGVLGIVFYTYSSLHSQKEELTKIRQSREILRISGPAAIDMQGLESFRANYASTGDKKLLLQYNETLSRLQNDSVQLSHLANINPGNAAAYQQLTGLIHQMIEYAASNLHRVPGADAGDQGEKGIKIIEQFDQVVTSLENKTREILNSSYDRSGVLMQKTILFVTIIVVLFAFVLIAVFSFIYRDIRRAQTKEEELKKFNLELEKQVDQKTAITREVFERVSDAFVALDKDWRYIYMNKKAGEILELERDKIIGKSIWDIFPGKAGQPFRTIYERAMKTQQYTYFEEFYAPFDHWFENHIYPSKEGLSIYFRDVTEKKKNEEAIKTNERQLQLIYNTTSDIIFLLSVEAEGQYRFDSVNQAFLSTTGLKAGEVVGKLINEVIPASSLPMVLENYRLAIQTRQPVEWEETSPYPSGQKTGIVQITPVFNDEGKCTMMVGVVHDITARKEAEQELVEAELKFRSLVEQSLVGVYIIQDGKFAYVNPQFALIFGYSQEELIGADPVKVIMPNDQARVSENVRARVAGEKESIHYEADGRQKNGEMIRIEVFCNGTLYAGSSAIIGTILDITERKKAEEDIIKANERFNLISSATHDAVWDWDILADRNWGNDIFYQYYGTKPEDPSNYETFLSRVHPDDKIRILEKLELAIKKQEESVVDEFRFRLPDGRYRFFYDRAFIVYDKEGKPVRMLGSMMDITEQHELEQEIVNQKVQAQKTITRAVLQAEERERNKIGQELHDNVNQILGSVKLFLSMMASQKNEERSDQLLKESMGLIDNAIQEIRLLSQSQVTPLKEVDLKELIRSLLYKLDEAGSLKASFQYDIKEEYFIEDDLKLNIYRIIQEQINNVIKHAEASHISISITADDQFIYSTVQDNGKGFYSSTKRRGIGISNMINRVESFNGELTIESSPGKGCKMDVKIPH